MGEPEQIVALIPRLRRYARALLGDRAAADDLVQDTLERAWLKLHLYQSGTNLRAWLFTVMHNVHVNRLRGRREEESLDESMYELVASQPATDGLLIRDLDRAVRSLPDEQREVLLLVVLEDMSYEQTAQTLSIPIGTVMSRLSRACEKLRLILSGQAASPRLQRVK